MALVAIKYSTKDKPRYVAGSIEPTNRTASISPNVENPGFRAITFDQLKVSYKEQVIGLIDGEADISMKTDNLVVGITGQCKGNIETHNADIWGNFDGDLKASGTLTIQEAGVVTGTIEYQKMQIKLGGDISGDIKKSDKIQSINTEKKQSDDNNNVSLQASIKTE